jgi:hypothetical protein
VNPVAYSAIPDSFPPQRRAFAMAIFASGSTIGGGLGVYLGSLLLDWAARTRRCSRSSGSSRPGRCCSSASACPAHEGGQAARGSGAGRLIPVNCIHYFPNLSQIKSFAA